MMKNAVLIISIPIIFFSDLLFAAIILIPADYPTIQEGINAANEGDTVLVSPGTYAENIIWPVVNGIKLIGEDRNTTIIDGNQSGSVIYFHDSTIDTSTLVSNFTIKNGSSSKGGGIYCFESEPSLINLLVSENSTSEYGGGIYCRFSDPVLVNVVISENSSSYGGGIYCSGSDPNLGNVTIKNNLASYGGGLYCITNSSPRGLPFVSTNSTPLDPSASKRKIFPPS